MRIGDEKMKTIWKKAERAESVIALLHKKLTLSPIAIKVLINRGLDTVDKINGFLNNSLNDMYDPFLMKDMDKAIEMMKNSIDSGDKIIVYGDYDADGVTSTAILYKAIKRCGGRVEYHIPHRENEGYGMNVNKIEAIADAGFDLIISCDNGISAIEEVKRAKELGLKVIITDHHELPFEEKDGVRKIIVPNSDALINPKQEDCQYPFKFLCGAAIAYKFSMALYKTMGINGGDELLELAAIGTICDVVDLIDENRIIAKEGLKVLSSTNNQGIKALKNVIGINDEVTCYNVGFAIGPCINATGRLETAELSLDLLLCEDYKKAMEIATKIFNLNKERQDLTMSSFEEVCETIDNSDLINDKILVVYNDHIHESIAGIVAGRVKEKYGKPTFILTKGKEMPKGSGRSIEEYNMFEEMLKCKEVLFKFGGHPMAAGLSIEEENIPKFRKMLNDNCNLNDNDLALKIKVDSLMKIKYIDESVVEEFKMLEPFGKGNPSPILGDLRIKVKEVRFLGAEQQHAKLKLNLGVESQTIDGIYFNGASEVEQMFISCYGENYMYHMMNPEDLYVDILFQPDINEYMGRRSIQLKIKSIRLSK